MLRLCAVALILSSSFGLPAQTPSTTPAPPPGNGRSTQTFAIALPQAACPVQMHALQGGTAELIAARKLQVITGPAQLIRLVLSQGQAQMIASAQVTVRGLSGRNRTLQTYTTGNLQPDLTRVLAVTFSTGKEPGVFANLLLPGFTAVLTVQLESITYKDGTTWNMPGTLACRVAPDPLVLVAGR
jgi:hypothetical protein